MERIISEQDRIRRAEEIAGRRRGTISVKNINTSKNKKMPWLVKLFIQTVSSMCIFGLIYFLSINNSQIIEAIKPYLSQDTDLQQLYNEANSGIQYVQGWISEVFNQDKNTQAHNDNENNNLNNENANENVNATNVEENVVDGENEEQKTEDEAAGGIGGSDENIELSQDEQDIAYIKQNASFIVPVYGTLTSGYGPRTPTDIISANHAGIDIGANEGTEIVASMEGTVELVSSYGDYGNHVKITNGEISTMYAHCKTIYVNQGDYVTQGQKIAEVGNTGRTTGPHLHFEIARDGRTVDPQAIIEI